MKKSPKFTESLARGLSVLYIVSKSSVPLTLTELSHQLDMSKSTVQRLSFTLETLGYLSRDEETKKYSLGPKILSVGLSAIGSYNLRKIAASYLKKTSKETGKTVSLAILDGNEIIFIERIKTREILNINLQVGSRLPAYCTSMGKALLAFLPEASLEQVLKEIKLRPLTPNTITRKEDLRKELKTVRFRGFATCNEEISIGLKSVAAPVRDYTGEVIAAINIASVSIQTSFESLEKEFSKKVIKTANEVSIAMGYKPKK